MSDLPVELPVGAREGPPARAEDAYTPNPRRWRILVVSLLVGFMSLLDVSIVNVAVPSMREGLHTSSATIQWVVSGYLLTFGLTLVAGGRLGDAYGRRRMMLIGLVGFTLASAAVGLAPTAGLVVAARLAQGALAGILTPQNSGLIQTLFRGAERAKAFGLFGFTVSTASATGPVIGGLILAAAGDDGGWRYLFLINVPIGVVAYVAVLRMVPRKVVQPSDPGAHIDFVGAGLLGLAVLALLFPVVRFESGTYWTLSLLLLVPVFAVMFLRWEERLVTRGRAPLLDLRLLRGLPGYVEGLTIGTLYFTGFTGLILVVSIYLQEGLDFTPLHAGLLLMPFAAGAAVAAPVAGRFVSDVGRRLTVIALATMIAGTVAFAVLAPGSSPLWVWAVPTLLIAGLGGGAVISPNVTITLSAVPPTMGGAAGGALQTGQRIGSAIGAAVLVTIYQVAAGALSPDAAVRYAAFAGLVVLVAALVMAIRALRHASILESARAPVSPGGS